ncbi:MAG: GNAT family N-acetyltransferase [Pyrinomonadaceae bacterium]
MQEQFIIRALTPDDAADLSTMLQAQSPDYVRFFYPFEFHLASISNVLANQRRDVLMGLYLESKIVVFFMLRGWNEGYDVPSFGIIVDENYRGYGLELISLDAAKVISRLRGAERMMLKMHPDNITAKGVARKIGFVQTGSESGGNLIYHLDLGKPVAKP